MSLYSNMYSATVLFVLKDMRDNLFQGKGEHIFAAAFGPGLTMKRLIMTAV
ncbi:MAG: hypothetical protein ACHQD8_04450 [Chitinophagales bacterium]